MIVSWRPNSAISRAGLRWSRWRLVALPLALVYVVLCFLLFSYALLKAQMLFVPRQANFCTPLQTASLVWFLAVAVFAIVLGFVLANLTLWSIPKSRHALQDAERKVGLSFVVANTFLLKATIWALALVLCVFAATPRVCLSSSRVYYFSHLFATPQEYDVSEISEARPKCTRSSRGGWNIALDLVMRDGSSFEFAAVPPWFSAWSQAILASLRAVPFNESAVDQGCPAGLRKTLSPPPTKAS